MRLTTYLNLLRSKRATVGFLWALFLSLTPAFATALGWSPVRISLSPVIDFPKTPYVIGLRLAGVPIELGEEDYEGPIVVGLDLGFYTISKKVFGIQTGLGYLFGKAEAERLYGVQLAPVSWTSADYLRGMQLGFINSAGDAKGLQIGVGGSHACRLVGLGIGTINVVGKYRRENKSWVVDPRCLRAGTVDQNQPSLAVQVGFLNGADSLIGLQIGALNEYGYSRNPGPALAAQVGIYNTAKNFRGAQIGLVNFSMDSLKGVQVGLVNICWGTLKGLQIGGVNVARRGKALLPLMFGFNVGF